MANPSACSPTCEHQGMGRSMGRALKLAVGLVAGLGLAVSLPSAVAAQVPREGEVRQLVTFSFLPGRSGDAIRRYREGAVPLYQQDESMLTFRGFREVESPVALDLMVVSSFDGMAGMDASNARLREVAAAAGTSIGALYGELGALSSAHTDQFVEMLPALGTGDASSRRLTAFVWYRVTPGARPGFEAAMSEVVEGPDRSTGTPSATGRFLVSDGWDYLRMLAFDSLADFQAYQDALSAHPSGRRLDGVIAARRQVILASVPELAVRD